MQNSDVFKYHTPTVKKVKNVYSPDELPMLYPASLSKRLKIGNRSALISAIFIIGCSRNKQQRESLRHQEYWCSPFPSSPRDDGSSVKPDRIQLPVPFIYSGQEQFLCRLCLITAEVGGRKYFLIVFSVRLTFPCIMNVWSVVPDNISTVRNKLFQENKKEGKTK